ncbi:MAG TPA: competence protein TfoX [Candidatus Pacebacteria bacterium]|nr:competence protein TfoX [Candidatus Paceibacterota bacterium]
MATKKATIDFLLDQLNHHAGVTARAMFGEYALYCQGKVVALVCDDELFLKPTQAGREQLSQLGEVIEKPPYPGAKPYFWISGDDWDDEKKLSQLILVTAQELPLPKPKKPSPKLKMRRH